MNKNLALSVIAVIVLSVIATTMMAVESSYATDSLRKKSSKVAEHLDAPIATSGENTYIIWWANSTGNDEVMFRASNDGGTTFADKINLSNTTGAESQDVEIAADGDNVIVTWWERNQTAEEPVVRISTDNGETFGSLLRLPSNGTIGAATTE
jgi:uncharacterized protein (UPF0333 family)